MQNLFSGTNKQSPAKIIIQTGEDTCNNTVINNNEKNTKPTTTRINNVHFGDDIEQDSQEHSKRIFYQNINELEFSTTSHTLLVTYIGMQDK